MKIAHFNILTKPYKIDDIKLHDKTNINNNYEKQNQDIKLYSEQNSEQKNNIDIEDLVITKEVIQTILSLGIPQSPSKNLPDIKSENWTRIDIRV